MMLDGGVLIPDEGCGKDRKFVRPGGAYRVRVTQIDEAATHLPTRGEGKSAPIGGGFCISITALDAADKVLLDANLDAISFGVDVVVIDQETLQSGADSPQVKVLTRIDTMLAAAERQRAGWSGMAAFVDEFVTLPPAPVDPPPEPLAVPSIPALP